MESAQNNMSCSTKFKILASFMGYAAVIASPFGLTVSGYSFGRAALAVMVLTVISVPAWMKVLRMKCVSGEAQAEIAESGEYAAV